MVGRACHSLPDLSVLLYFAGFCAGNTPSIKLSHCRVHLFLLYFAGFCVGNTPLIKLSPKKTWEGFVGGLIMTVLASWWLGEYMSRFKWMICPRTVRSFTLPRCVILHALDKADEIHVCSLLRHPAVARMSNDIVAQEGRHMPAIHSSAGCCQSCWLLQTQLMTHCTRLRHAHCRARADHVSCKAQQSADAL